MIIFLFGPDTFRSREKLTELKEKFLREIDPSGINIHILDGTTATIEEIEKNLLSPSFLAKKRMVIIEKFFFRQHMDTVMKKFDELLQKNIAKDTIIVIWEEEVEEKKLKNNSLFTFLSKQTYACRFDLLPPIKVQLWVRQEIKKRGGTIHSTAVIYLSDIIGADLWLANMEISKLLAYTNGREITLRDIKNLCSSRLEENIFLLTDALGHKNMRLATQLIHNQIQGGISHSELLHMCLWQFKNLLIIKNYIDCEKETNPYIIAKKLNLHPFIIKKGSQQIKNFTIDELKNIYQGLVDIDLKIKTNQINTEVLFDLLAVK